MHPLIWKPYLPLHYEMKMLSNAIAKQCKYPTIKQTAISSLQSYRQLWPAGRICIFFMLSALHMIELDSFFNLSCDIGSNSWFLKFYFSAWKLILLAITVIGYALAGQWICCSLSKVVHNEKRGSETDPSIFMMEASKYWHSLLQIWNASYNFCQ